MATYVKYDEFVEHLCNGPLDLFGTTGNCDVCKIVIHTDAPAAADNDLTDLTQIAGNNGYTTGGENITYQASRTGGIVTATAVDVVWTAVTGNLGSSTTGRYFSIYDDTVTTPLADVLMASYDYGATFTVAAGETMTVDFQTSLWTLQ